MGKSNYDWSVEGIKDTVKGAGMTLMDSMNQMKKDLLESKPTNGPESVADDKKRKKRSKALVFSKMGEAADIQDDIDKEDQSK